MDRYFVVARRLKDLLQEVRHGKMSSKNPEHESNIQKFLISFLRAPYFSIELDPSLTLEEIKNDHEGLNHFFGFPYQQFILDFPPLKNIRNDEFSPLLFCRMISDKLIYVQDFTAINTQDLVSKVDKYASHMPNEFNAMSAREKADIINRFFMELPGGTNSFMATSDNGDWSRPKIMFNVFNNLHCPLNDQTDSKNVLVVEGGDVPPYFRRCSFFNNQEGCKGYLDRQCNSNVVFARHVWHLIFYALIYINYPAHVIIEESQKLTPREERQQKKQIKPDAINVKRPILRVVSAGDIIKRKHSEGEGTHASPIPHLRRGHWRQLRSDYYKNKKDEAVWIRDVKVNGELIWHDGNITYKVVDPPSRKFKI